MADSSRFQFSAGSIGTDGFAVVRITGSEAISLPFAFDVDVLALSCDASAMRRLLGARARILFAGADGRRVTGIVTALRALTRGQDFKFLQYRVTVLPRLHVLSLRRTTRIFQEMSVPEIVRAVLAPMRVQNEWRTQGLYSARTYCLQYQETDLEFITRLCAEEGIFYFIADPREDTGQPGDSGATETVVFADTVAVYGEISGDARLPLREAGALHRPGSEQVSTFSFGEEIGSGAVLQRAFDFKRPHFDLRGEAEIVGSDIAIELTELHLYDHERDPREHNIHADGARVSLEQARARTALGHGESDCQRLAPASLFELEDHPHEDLCARYAVVGVDHEIEQASLDVSATAHPWSYRNRFRCVPETVAFRPSPQRRTLQQVVETATVTGPPGEEIYVDELGRIKVQFHWDLHGHRDEHSSCWVRVSQTWSGATWGAQFIPRIGMEVVVTFVGGDVDRPLVTGAVYNAKNPPPFTLPAHKTQSGIRTRSTPGGNGFNELRFEDAQGNEQVYLHAQKDFDELAENNHTRTVHGDEAIAVGRTSRITIGSDQELSVDGNEVVTLNKNFILHIVGKQVMHVDGTSVSGSGTTRAEAPKPSAAAPMQSAGGTSGSPAELLAHELLQRQVADARLLFLGEHVPDELYAQGRRICEQLSSWHEALATLQTDAAGLASSPALGSTPGHALLERLEVVRRATALREQVDQGVKRMTVRLPEGLRALQRFAVARADELRLGALGVEQGYALVGPQGIRPATFLVRGSGVGGGGATPPGAASDPAPTTPAASPASSGTPTAPEPQGKTVDDMVHDNQPTLPGFESSSDVKVVKSGTGFLGAPDGFAIQAGGATITIKDGNISLEAPGTISLKAAAVTIEAGSVSVQASSIVESASAIVQGAGTISLNGSAAIVAVGGVITLN